MSLETCSQDRYVGKIDTNNREKLGRKHHFVVDLKDIQLLSIKRVQKVLISLVKCQDYMKI